MADALPISVVIPVRNEAANLGRCLAALRDDFAEVLVVDSHSTDGTCQIAVERGVRLIQFEWAGGFPKKRNWVLRTVPLASEWVLFLDADEEVTPSFVGELRRVLPATHCAGFWLRYRNYFMGRWLRFGDRFSKLALFRRGAGEYERIDDTGWSDLDMEVHEHPVLAGPAGRIRSPLLHHDYKGLDAYLARHDSYARWEARRYLGLRPGDWSRLNRRQRLKYALMGTPFLGPAYFVATYAGKLGFLDGRAGFWFAWHKMRYFRKIRQCIVETQKGTGEAACGSRG